MFEFCELSGNLKRKIGKELAFYAEFLDVNGKKRSSFNCTDTQTKPNLVETSKKNLRK